MFFFVRKFSQSVIHRRLFEVKINLREQDVKLYFTQIIYRHATLFLIIRDISVNIGNKNQ